MAENSGIEWTDHTFNPWIGCTKVSPGCDHCYAERREDKRLHRVQWGAGQPRQRTKTWGAPVRWNASAEHFAECTGCGLRGDRRTWRDDIRKRHPAAITCCPDEKLVPARQRVFCASLADVFDNEVPPEWREDLFGLIRKTPNLDWLLLTKRIGNAAPMIKAALANFDIGYDPAFAAWPWPNVWLGATVVDQAEADRDVPKLLAVPARVRFLSIEPMLGPISFEGLFASPRVNEGTNALEALDWVICGGESGPGARPMHPDWALNLCDQCELAGVPFLFKQWGEWAGDLGSPTAQVDPKAWNAKVWPDLSVQWRVGKKSAGRLLDGRTHDGFPLPVAP